MEQKWIDTHAHYNHGRFKGKGKVFMDKAFESTEFIINVGTNMKSNQETLQMVSTYDNVYGILGFFPVDVWELEPGAHNNAEANWNAFKKQLANDKIVAIGEIGLDYNWDKVGNYAVGEEARLLQQKWFINQIDLAKEIGKPICVHSRDAEKDTRAIFKRYNHIDGVIHCYSYDAAMARFVIGKGLYLGIGGTSTYKASGDIRDAIKMCPIDRLVLETDAPYLSPEPVRRETNHSGHITYVIDNICKIKGLSRKQVIEQTNANAKKLFGIL